MKAAAGLLLVLAGPACAGQAFVGVASDPAHGTALYEEHHYVRDDGERLVVYRCGDGTAFARKHVQAGGEPEAPEFSLDDARFGYREGVQRRGGVLEARVQRSTAHAEQRSAVAVTPRLVIDAGFDVFVRRHWEALQRGESVALDFLVPSRRRTYAFAVKKLGGEAIDGEMASVLRLAPSGVLGWFAPAIEVVYRDRDRQLQRFSGITNVRANPDDSISARIVFPAARVHALQAGEWAAALHAPLAACRVPG